MFFLGSSCGFPGQLLEAREVLDACLILSPQVKGTSSCSLLETSLEVERKKFRVQSTSSIDYDVIKVFAT